MMMMMVTWIIRSIRNVCLLLLSLTRTRTRLLSFCSRLFSSNFILWFYSNDTENSVIRILVSLSCWLPLLTSSFPFGAGNAHNSWCGIVHLFVTRTHRERIFLAKHKLFFRNCWQREFLPLRSVHALSLSRVFYVSLLLFLSSLVTFCCHLWLFPRIRLDGKNSANVISDSL